MARLWINSLSMNIEGNYHASRERETPEYASLDIRFTGDFDSVRELAEIGAVENSMKMSEKLIRGAMNTYAKCTWCSGQMPRALALFSVSPGGMTNPIGAICQQCADQIDMLKEQIKAAGV